MDDDNLDPKSTDGGDELDEDILPSKEKIEHDGDGFDAEDSDSFDDLADKESDVLGEDGFDDVDPW